MNVAMIKAGGIGTRMNAGIPKQFVKVNDIPIIIYTLSAFEKHKGIDEILIVCVEEWIDEMWKYIREYNITKVKSIIKGGTTSLRSIKCGVDELVKDHNDNDFVLIHDANRPLVSEQIITDVLDKSDIYGNAVAAIQSTDEIMISNDSISSDQYVNRKSIYRIQTPDSYRLKDIYSYINSASEDELDYIGSTNTLVIAKGGKMHFAEGSELNIRLTKQEDISLFKGILDIRSSEINR